MFKYRMCKQQPQKGRFQITTVNVIGAGLSGCEAAWQLSRQNIHVLLYEMKPISKSPAHKTDNFAELVCSNSLRSNSLSNAAGLLKSELRYCSSLILEAADTTRIPAGDALAVDREKFSNYITEKIKNSSNIDVIYGEVQSISELENKSPVIVATGPLTSKTLAHSIVALTGEDNLHFYDAAAPIVTADSIDLDKAFIMSRYGNGQDYINCPLTKEEYDAFYNALINANTIPLKNFETPNVFEGCIPIEIMAKRGYKTLCFGPMKPKGLIDPKTGREPYAVVQLRKENKSGTMYNMVGFQTNLTFNEQIRVFSLIPALKEAEYLRYGVMHRNTFLNSPKLLNSKFCLKSNQNIRFAGQITGTEGYIESAAGGLMSALYLAMELKGCNMEPLSGFTALGALGNYISSSSSYDFQPSHFHFGLVPRLNKKIKNKKEKNLQIALRALEYLNKDITKYGFERC